MLHGRPTLGHVVSIEGQRIIFNLSSAHKGSVAAHPDGISTIGQPEDLIGCISGVNLIVLQIHSIRYLDPHAIEAIRTGDIHKDPSPPLRQITAHVLGIIEKIEENSVFRPETLISPPLGSTAHPLTNFEVELVFNSRAPRGPRAIKVGVDARTLSTPVRLDVNELLSKHLTVLGSTGQGKTNFVALVCQRILKLDSRARLIVFDVNGEYASAFSHLEDSQVKRTIIGRSGINEGFKIPYYAYGRNGLFRMLLPSDRAQMPALRFALEHLHYIESEGEGARPAGEARNVFFDDCRPGNATDAYEGLEMLRRLRAEGTRNAARRWPHMRAIASLVADFYDLQRARNGGWERTAFQYSHVASLINRIHSLINDSRFTSVVNVEGSELTDHPIGGMQYEARNLVQKFFGQARATDDQWKIHIIDVSKVHTDLMPYVLAPLLDILSNEMFYRGPGGTDPTILVLEEAHHYLREMPGDTANESSSLAYERLAKEGRKFGAGLITSTQRPSELSPTVLSQSGTWAVFRLLNEADIKSVSVASGDSIASRRIAGLPRGSALLFGAAAPVPLIAKVDPADPPPDSSDPEFL